MKGLTPRQREILDYIKDYIKMHQFSPSYREIMAHFDFSSIGTVSKHIKVLERKGMLTSENNGARSLLPKEYAEEKPLSSDIRIPFIGNITGGAPIEMFPNTQMLTIPDFLVNDPDKTYVLRVRGNTLNDEMICDGDLLIVEARPEAFAGEKILGSIYDSGSLIRLYFPEGNTVRLTSSSQEEFTIRSDELTIQGIVIGLLRLFS